MNSPPPSPPPLRAGITRSLAWCGEVMAANAEDVWQLTSEYMRVFAASGATLIVVNLARLRAIDATGADLMLRVRRGARQLGVAILFAEPQPNVQQVLQLTALDRLLLEGAQ